MKDDLQPFNTVFENYLFSIASRFIDQFDNKNQTSLINLISSLETESTPVGSEETACSPLPIQHLEKQWRSLLNTPRKRKKVSKKGTNPFLLDVAQRRMQYYQEVIDQTNAMIHKLEVARQSFTNRNCGLPQREKLDSSYALALQRNKDYLAIAIGQQEIVSKRLAQLLHSA